MHAAHRAHLPFFAAAMVAVGLVSSTVRAQVIAAGVDHNCARSSAGGTVCWGSNQYGQIGDGTTVTRVMPTNIDLPFGVTALTGNWGHSCAVTPSGGLKCWGWNDFGQLGDGSKAQRNAPVDVSGLTSGIAKVAAGYGHTCALTTSGAVKCWGADFSPSSNAGQLGNGSNAGALTPADVIGLSSGALAIATGRNFACAVASTGGAKCWGANDFDQLGNNDPMFLDRNAPVDVFNLTSGVAGLAAGETHACALTTGGGVKCWGRGDTGALGDGIVYAAGTTHNQPGDVVGLTSGVAQIAAGSGHTCAMKTNGDVLCWGLNNQGQVGDGTATNRLVPVQVASGAIAVAAGYFHTCILTAPGVSQCWGNNAQGNLGNGTQGGASYVPVSSTYPAATTTMLASGSNPSVFGDSVTFTATVTGGTHGVGVRFEADGATIPGCSAVALASGSAACATTGLQGGGRSIRVTYLGNATTLASQSAALSQIVNPAEQTITFDPLPAQNDNDPPFTIAANASSGLAVTFSSLTTSVCTVAGTTVTLQPSQGGNTCTIAANQVGNANYNAAVQVTQGFSILGTLPPLTLVSVKSRKTHGAAGDFDIAINPATLVTGNVDVECRAIGTGHRIVFTFNNPITATGTIAITDKDGNPFVGASPALSVSGNDVTVTVTGIPDNRRAKFTLTNVNTSGLTFSASVGFLIGDINNSRSVTGTDVGVVRGRSGQALTSVNFKSDLNASGTLTGTDVSVVRPRSGLVIP
jgi:alpha-tubulin suppressor-like RCC1 family protein